MRLQLAGHIYKPFIKAELEVLYDEFLFSRDVKVTTLKAPTLTALAPIMSTTEAEETTAEAPTEESTDSTEGAETPEPAPAPEPHHAFICTSTSLDEC